MSGVLSQLNYVEVFKKGNVFRSDLTFNPR
jgi:hypothetical protein